MARESYDAVIVGASLAGCATAMLLAREGASVALVEKQPDPAAFKRVCSHLIQPSAVPTLERLGLLEPMMAAGAVRSGIRAHTRWGLVAAPPERASGGVNLRREVLDPLLREMAGQTPGVDLMLGRTAVRLPTGDGRFLGAVVRDRDGTEVELRSKLLIGADGRDSRVARMAGVRERVLPHGRFAYGAYFEGEMPEGAPNATIWFGDPQWAAVFPTDGEQVFYVAMPTKDRLPEFKRDPDRALVEYVADFPEAPPILSARRVSDVIGKVEMPNRVRRQTGPGLALVGDAALAADPLFGIGCGWAFQSAEWLADSVAPALVGGASLEAGLRRYRRLHSRRLGPHAFLIHDYSNGRRFNPMERMMFATGAHDTEVATAIDLYATRQISPLGMLSRAAPRMAAFQARSALAGRR